MTLNETKKKPTQVLDFEEKHLKSTMWRCADDGLMR
jgi:hypothetical protein